MTMMMSGSVTERTAILGFRNALVEASVTGQSSDQYPITNAFDHMDSTEFSPAQETGVSVFEFEFTYPKDINYFALLSKSGETSGLTVKVELFDTREDRYITVAEGLKSDRNGQPIIAYFGKEGHFSSKVKLSFDHTQRMHIVIMNCGLAHVFDQTPSFGYRPGYMGVQDVVSHAITEGNNFIMSRRRERGHLCRATFGHENIRGLEGWYIDYQQHCLDGKVVFFSGDTQNHHDCICGRQDPKKLSHPSYKNSFHSDITIEIMGYV